jgi:hypothetical protein
MLRWTDGVLAGLVAGVLAVLVSWWISLAFPQVAGLDVVYARWFGTTLGALRIDAPFLGLILGIVLYVLVSTLGGIAYGALAVAVAGTWRSPSSVIYGLLYGCALFFVLEDVLVPILEVSSRQPLWVGLVCDVIVQGIVVSEAVTLAHRRRLTATSG